MNRTLIHPTFRIPLLAVFVIYGAAIGRSEDSGQLRIAAFSTDITIPIGHRCMGILKTKSRRIEDPLEAHGLALLGSGPAVVIVALDWCEVRNGAYDQWRDAMAAAANTTRNHVLVCSLHQHDAPVTDSGAQEYLDTVGLNGELYDVNFQRQCIRRAAEAMKGAIDQAPPLTQIGIGQAKVDKIASNRRVVHADGSIRFDRYSRTSADSYQAQADEGEIDPMLRSITFYSGDQAMKEASTGTTKQSISKSTFRCETFRLPFNIDESLTRESMLRVLHDDATTIENRITAAMGLSSLDRIERGQPIDLPCLELGTSRIVLLPGESFVGYQLMAGRLRDDRLVMAIGYGECWPGYIPTEQAFEEGFDHGWRWVGRGCEAIIREKLDRVLGP